MKQLQKVRTLKCNFFNVYFQRKTRKKQKFKQPEKWLEKMKCNLFQISLSMSIFTKWNILEKEVEKKNTQQTTDIYLQPNYNKKTWGE